MSPEILSSAQDQSFSSSFFNSLLRALEESSGSSWQRSEDAEPGVVPEEAESVRISLAVDGSLQGGFELELRRSEASMITSKLLKAEPGEFGPEQSVALVKLVASAGSTLCSELQPEYGTFTIDARIGAEQSADRASTARLTASDDLGNCVPIWMFTDSPLTERLAAHSRSRAARLDSQKVRQASGPSVSVEQVNLELVLDVELNVTLRFGKRQLSLREVLELTSGSVVELDRQVDEPVELLLDGVVIARGEAVVVDGNYGLRVTEVTKPLSSAMLQ